MKYDMEDFQVGVCILGELIDQDIVLEKIV